jgi:hypothetical protein
MFIVHAESFWLDYGLSVVRTQTLRATGTYLGKDRV